MELECPICISPFDETDVRPLVGICGHSMCESCLRPGISCSICRKEDAFRFRTVNYQLIELISKQVENLKLQEEMKKQLEDALADKTSTTSIDEVDDMEGYVHCEKCKEKTSEERVRICFECSTLYAVLQLDSVELFCISCWLESEHSDHNTLRYSEVKDDLLEMRRMYNNNEKNNQKCSALAELIRQKSSNNTQIFGTAFDHLARMKLTLASMNGREKQILKCMDELRNVLFSFEEYNTEFERVLSLRDDEDDSEIMSFLSEKGAESGEDGKEPVACRRQLVVFDDFDSDYVAHILDPEEAVESFFTKIKKIHNIDKDMRLYTESWDSVEEGTVASNGIENLSKVYVVCNASVEEEPSEEDCRL